MGYYAEHQTHISKISMMNMDTLIKYTVYVKLNSWSEKAVKN